MEKGAEKGAEIFHAWQHTAQNANFLTRLVQTDGIRTCATDKRTPPLPLPLPPPLQGYEDGVSAAAASSAGSIAGLREMKYRNEFSSASLSFPLRFTAGFVAAAPPHVTVVLEGRSICQRICLEEHANYDTFAQALRNLFANMIDVDMISGEGECVNLSNAIPGYLIAYEDIEGDLLLAGDLSWKDFVRAAKRIRILPAKNPSKKTLSC